MPDPNPSIDAIAPVPPRWRADLLAGLAVAGVLLPEAVAYAAIAGVAPQHALLAALVGLCVYPWFGTSRFAVVAPTSSAAAVMATIIVASGPGLGYLLVTVTGGLFLIMAALRGGFLGAFISRPVLRGFAWALALTIVLRQLPQILGVEVGTGPTAVLIGELLAAAPGLHLPSLAWGGTALLLWLTLRYSPVRRRFQSASLWVLVLGVALSAWLAPAAQGVVLVGDIHWQALSWTLLPPLGSEHWLHTFGVAPALLLLLFAESWGTVRTLALRRGDRVDADRELLALGAANLLSGLLQGLPVGAGFSASAANEAAGARSRWAGVATALALGALLWVGHGWLALLPLPVLAAVVVGILSHSLSPRELLTSLRLGADGWLAFVTATGVLLWGVPIGMLLAVALSVLVAIRRFSQPVVSELGELPGTRDYIDRALHPEALATPGTLIMRPEEPLFFANAEQVFHFVRQRAETQGARVVVLSLEVCDELDSTALEALAEFAAGLRRHGIALLLARVKDRPREAMRRMGLADGETAGVRLFWSVADAVQAAGQSGASSLPAHGS